MTKVKKAIIPTAVLDTQLLPAAKAMPREILEKLLMKKAAK